MFCFKDKTFCTASDSGCCDNTSCWRFFTEEERRDYQRWSNSFNDGTGPIAFADFSYNCDYYRDKFLTEEDKKI